jgi:hypothetical protein
MKFIYFDHLILTSSEIIFHFVLYMYQFYKENFQMFDYDYIF